MKLILYILLIELIINCYALQCTVNNGQCNINAKCKQIDNLSVKCICKEGYEGNGINCTQIQHTYKTGEEIENLRKDNGNNNWIYVILGFTGCIAIAIGIFGVIKMKEYKKSTIKEELIKPGSPKKRPQPDLY